MPPSHDYRYHSNFPSGYNDIIRHFRESPNSDPSMIERLNIEQMFILIDGILPIEACLFYEVLPLFLEGSRLNLGMVSPDDTSAIDYVRRIVSYLNYSLVTHPISSGALRASLTAYLRYTDEKSKTQALPEPSAAARRVKRLSDRENAPLNVDAGVQPTLIVDGPEMLDPSEIAPEDFPGYSRDWSIDDASTITIGIFDESSPDIEAIDTADEASPTAASDASSPSQGVDREQPPPSVEEAEEEVDFPSIPDVLDIDDITDGDSTDDDSAHGDSAHGDNAYGDGADGDGADGDGADIDTAKVNRYPGGQFLGEETTPDTNSQDSEPVPPFSPPESPTAPGASQVLEQPEPAIPATSKPTLPALSSTLGKSAPSGLLRSPLKLQLNAGDRRVAIEELHTLPAHDLLQELLVRVLDQGIGRLYFERNQQVGRILWSESGVVQSIVEDLTHDRFTQVLEELKGLTRLTVQATDKPLQIELERMYQNERLLLRFRFIPTKFGEEATLQVLRGAALRFYQQQQLSKLSHDALSTAQILQAKVNAIRDRMLAASELSGNRPTMPPALAQMINQIESQLEALRQSHIDNTSQPSRSQDTSGNS